MFRLEAYNEIDSVETDDVSIVLAAVPDTPTTAPTQVYSETSSSQIKITYTALLVAENGGSDILGYDLWRDDGQNGDFTSLYSTNNVLATSFIDYNVDKGYTYRYQYRARNINGYSDFSPIGYLICADVPSKPAAPTLTSVDSTTIDLVLYSPLDTGGAELESYELERDGGSLNTAFISVASYTSPSLTSSITTSAPDSLTTSDIYSFRFRAKNAIGYSEYSEILRVALGDQVLAPTNLAKDLDNTGANYIGITWDAVPDADLPTLGYVV